MEVLSYVLVGWLCFSAGYGVRAVLDHCRKREVEFIEEAQEECAD